MGSAGSSVSGAEGEVLDARLRVLAALATGSSEPAHRVSWALPSARVMRIIDRGAGPWVQVLLETDGSFEEPTALSPDIRINGTCGSAVRTAYLRAKELPSLARLKGVKRVVPSTSFEPALDLAAWHCWAQREPGPAPLGAFGQGDSRVLIGFIDSGLDAAHPAFQGRVVGIWDQTLHGQGVSGADYGLWLQRPAELQLSLDESGHGTHVAGVAASADSTYRGMNPSAQLAMVKTGFTDAEILDGARFLVDLGRQRGVPVVLNLSLGAHGGPHDGTGPLSRGLDALCGPGVAICCAAGNEGAADRHAALVVRGSVGLRFELGSTVRGSYPSAHMLLWSSTAAGLVEVALEDPTGRRSPFYAVRDPRLGAVSYSLGGMDLRLLNCVPHPGQQKVVLDLEPLHRHSQSVGWKLWIRASEQAAGVPVDLWTVAPQVGEAARFSDYVQSEGTIGAPGDAQRVITVGAWSSRPWPPDGLQPAPAGHGTGVAGFSSRGPLRDLRTKPELVAPGEWVVAPLSRTAQIPKTHQVGSDHWAARGTSQATAVVSGWISLLLAQNPTLTPEQVRQRLMDVALRPQGASVHAWGAGLLRLR